MTYLLLTKDMTLDKKIWRSRIRVEGQQQSIIQLTSQCCCHYFFTILFFDVNVTCCLLASITILFFYVIVPFFIFSMASQLLYMLCTFIICYTQVNVFSTFIKQEYDCIHVTFLDFTFKIILNILLLSYTIPVQFCKILDL